MRRAKLLFPMPKPSTTTELFRLWSSLRFPEPSAAISCPNSEPITPSNTTAVVCLRRNSAAEDGLRVVSSKNILEEWYYFLYSRNGPLIKVKISAS